MSLLKSLCYPLSVAFIGVSRKTGTGALNPLQVLKEFGYKGRVYPVNPAGEYILGYRCYKKVQEIPEVPDLAVIMVNRDLVPNILRQCADKGIKTSIVISDGFAESDEKGKMLQRELESICKNTGIRILGPNSMGVVNCFHSFTTSFVRLGLQNYPVAFLGQSGLFLQGFSNLCIGMAIDIGNGCDIKFSELISELLEDDNIRIISIHMEELSRPELFSKVIREKGHKKPIIIFKSGKSKEAKKAISSHSGAIAGDYLIYKAFFTSLGLLVAESTQQLEDVVYLLLKTKVPEKKKIGIITPSGGAGIICLDAMERYGFELSRLSDDTVAKMKALFPPYYSPSNPLDIMSASFRHGYKKVYTEALTSMLEDDNVDIIFCINGLPTVKTINSVIKEKKAQKPVLSWIIGEYEDEIKKRIKDSTVPIFFHPERAFKALDICIEYKRARSLNKEPEFTAINKDRIKSILKDAEKEEMDYLFSHAFKILNCIELPVPKTVEVHQESEIKDIFSKIKPPVCMKFEVKGKIHKARSGLIKFGLISEDEIMNFWKQVLSCINKKDLRAVLLQEEVSKGIELFIGIKRDQKLGAVMIIGKGGTDVEIYNDIEAVMIPFNKEQAINAFRKTKIAKRLKEKNINEFADMMIKISTLCTEFPVIKEMDLNPIILNQDGFWIVDAKIII